VSAQFEIARGYGRVHRGKNVDANDVVVYDIFITAPDKPTTVNIPAKGALHHWMKRSKQHAK
jgi:hypothetical protein